MTAPYGNFAHDFILGPCCREGVIRFKKILKTRSPLFNFRLNVPDVLPDLSLIMYVHKNQEVISWQIKK
jgi:hypothetical protein